MGKYSLFILVIALFASACSVEKKMKRQIKKATQTMFIYPDSFARPCNILFPVIPRYIQGRDSIIERTVTIKGDSIPCTKDNVGTNIKCPDTKILYRDRFRVDTIIKRDSSLTRVLMNNINQSNKKIADRDNEIKDLKDKLEHKTKLASERLMYLIFLAILFGGSVFLLFKKW